jgi:hypothetical protein
MAQDEYRELDDYEVLALPSLDGLTTGVTLVNFKTLGKLDKTTGELVPWKHVADFRTDGGRLLPGHRAQPSNDPSSKVMRWAAALNGGTLPVPVRMKELIGRRMIVDLRANEKGFLLLDNPRPADEATEDEF